MTIENTIYVRATRAAVKQAIRSLSTAARSGGAVADAMMTRCGMAVLHRIHHAFIVKSKGGTDEAGDSWKALSPKTIAYSRRHIHKPGDPKQSRVFTRAKKPKWIPKSSGRAAYGPSYALTDKQRKMWEAINATHGPRIAWTAVKAAGATTLMEQYGNAQVDILRDTGLLLNSLSPGTTSPNQVFRVGPGEVIVGTNRKFAGVHHYGSRNGRIPQRRLWPSVDRWPASWWGDIQQQVQAGLLDLAILTLKQMGG